ncbi:MAG: FHA domain-containing protein, partial [Phycisphaerales bacterium]
MPEHWLISTTAGRDARHRLVPPGPVTIGRARDASIVLDDRSVSRRHATLEWLPDAGAWRVINEAGTGGTWVNGVRMSSGVGLTLRAGDSLRIPPWEFRLVAADGSTAMADFGADDGAGAVRALAVPDAATLAQHRLVLLLGAAEAIHRAPSIAAARQALADHALRATGFDGAALLRAAG